MTTDVDDRPYRTLPGDVLRDPVTGDCREVVTVHRSEDLHLFIDGSCYRQRATETTAMTTAGHRRGPMPPHF